MGDRDTIRRALYDAIGWQQGLADAYSHIPDSQERTDALTMADRYRALLRRKYGVVETNDERLDRTGVSVGIEEIRAWEPTENVGTHETHVGTHEK